MFAASLVSAQSGHSVEIHTWKCQELDFLVVEQYTVVLKSLHTLDECMIFGQFFREYEW